MALGQVAQEMTGTTEEEAVAVVASGQAVHGTTGEEAVASGQVAQGRCTLQHAQTVVRRHRYLSYHPTTDQYTAENATRTTDHQKGSKTT